MSNAKIVPHWILSKDSFVKICIRGLFDTEDSYRKIIGFSNLKLLERSLICDINSYQKFKKDIY